MIQDSQANHDFISLEGNATDLCFVPLETQKLNQLYEKPKQLKLNQNTFSLEGLKAELEQAKRNFHFSGHGSHNFSHPNQSALFFEQVIDEQNNRKQYKLTAYDIYHNLSAKFKQYSLATLSACEMGCANPESITSEYVGISSVLLSCGLKAVISPLWKVEEDFSTLMMVELHKRLREKNETPNIALFQVKKWLQHLTSQELIQYLDELYTQVQSLQIEASSKEEKDSWKTLQRKLGERLNELEKQSPSGNPFNHPYYLDAFICHGLSF